MTDNMAFLAHRHGLAHTDCWCAHCENAAKQRLAYQPKPPTCGANIEGPIVRQSGRSRPLWRRPCRRRVQSWGDRCYQHRKEASQ